MSDEKALLPKGSCAIAPHIVLEWLGEPYQAILLEEGSTWKAAYLAINPRGLVPALVENDLVLTENVAILMHLADQSPAANLAPEIGMQRSQMLSWLVFLSSTVHPAYSTLWHTERFTTQPDQYDAVKEAAEKRLSIAYSDIDRHLARNDFILGSVKTIADAYLYVFGRWGRGLKKPTKLYPNFDRFTEQMEQDEAVQQVLVQQGLS
jgi:glutathione S-transferase